MKNIALGWILVVALVGLAGSVRAEPGDVVADLEARLAELEAKVAELDPPQANFIATWKNGLALGTRDGRFLLKFGGRIQNDWSFFRADDALEGAVGGFEDGVEFRRLRFFAEGKVFEFYNYKLELDFASGSATLTDAYFRISKIPFWGNLQLGHFKEPVGLEALTSSKYITFIERSLPTAMTPGRNTGALAQNNIRDGRMTYSVGVFKETDGQGMAKRDGKFNVALRVTGLPWFHSQARYLHLGLGYSHRNPTTDLYAISQRPEAHLAPMMAGIADLAVDQVEIFSLEAALGIDLFSFQGEFLQTKADPMEGDSIEINGYYVTIGFFVTGDHRPFKRHTAAFGRVRPNTSLLEGDDGAGAGAVQLALRYSALDLEDEDINGGQMRDITFAANWWPNPNLRVMLNLVHSKLRDVGKANALVGRVQIDF